MSQTLIGSANLEKKQYCKLLPYAAYVLQLELSLPQTDLCRIAGCKPGEVAETLADPSTGLSHLCCSSACTQEACCTHSVLSQQFTAGSCKLSTPPAC